MKILAIVLAQLFFGQMLNAQNIGRIIYEETIKFDIQIEGLSEEMKKMIPDAKTLKKELLFKANESIYKNCKGEAVEDVNMESDDGSFKIQIRMDDEVEEVLYKNLSENNKVHQKGIMGKAFIVEDLLQKMDWKLTGEKIKYLGYECQKAVIENDEEFIVAWFTSAIPCQFGPDAYHGLPGAILMVSVNENEREIIATKIDLDGEKLSEINPPNDGKKVSEDQFEKIRIEKEEEIKKMYSTQRN